MPPLEQQNFHDTAVLWEKTGDDYEGEPIVSDTPTEIACRWENRQTQSMNPDGTVIGLDAQVYVRQDIVVDSLMMKGSLTDLTGTGFDDPDPLLMQVKSVRVLTDLKGRVTFRQIGLMRFRGKLPNTLS